MHNYYLLVTEANHRQAEHERRVQAVENDILTADLSASRLRSWRRRLAHVRLVPLARLPVLDVHSSRFSLGADRVGS